MKTLNVYIAHYNILKQRDTYINVFNNFMQKCSEKINFKLNIHICSDPSPIHVSNNIEQLNKRVNYEKSSDGCEFASLISPLNIHQISNIEVHREIYKQIQKMNGDDIYHLVVEDDIVINENYIENIENMLRIVLYENTIEWDIIFTCIANSKQVDDKILLVPFANSYKILLNKSSYFIQPKLAKHLFDYFETFKYNLKVGISKYLYDNSDQKAFVLNKHTFLEGSKIGIFPSSTNTTNFLFQNTDYVKLVNISNKEEIDESDIRNAVSIYNNQKHLESPDILHTMGIIYFKTKKYEMAKQYMLEACEKIESGNGIISKNSNILNNAINIHKYEQDMLDSCIIQQSKYS